MTCNTCKCNKVCDHNKYGFENCNNYISADVVEVVRCKDCKHAKAKEYYGCACQNRNTPWFNDEYEVYMNFNDFCSFAERKDT